MDIKILVAMHKDAWLVSDLEENTYLPIQVGAAGKALVQNANPKGIHKIQRDDQGDNISAKNPHYCELTALYWAWKNLSCDVVGLAHYRRYFALNRGLSDKSGAGFFATFYRAVDYEALLKENTVLFVAPTHFEETVYEQYKNGHHIEDLDRVKTIINDLYPDYIPAFEQVMRGHTLYLWNMCVMKKSDFDDYCQWLFTILFTLEKQIDISQYDVYQSRVYGFLGERLLNVWAAKHTELTPICIGGCTPT